ncbi:BA14K family protein [Hoeflea prorocentri]|uniref:Lectin-like protein BA14k n=1 Tax=Hoeflea prorocentri TaxID=1922333 RepID=A0A9X3UF48_9HYPH|nr:BA14K family protein [Hoeflea prorocentri]MCY6379571.1 BA14K family protein [Hoeflea prorocentri]MDA5397371.1 BA14K family protein [Hoeflea prorocentri]
MGNPVKVLVATLAVTAATLAPLSQSYAHDHGKRHYHDHYGDRGWYGPKPRKHKRKRGPVVIERNNGDDAVLYGILGLAAGALITGALLSSPPPQRRYSPPPRAYNPPPSAYDRPSHDYYPPAPRPSPVYAEGKYEPWTDEWYRYCSQRYRSFNPATGNFRGYDGYDHFCIAR